MRKRCFLIAALAVIAVGLLAGVISRPAACWHPGLARNIGIAEQACE
jgi:hypothetical protein